MTAWQALKGISREAWLGLRYAVAPPGGRLWRVHHRLKTEWDSHILPVPPPDPPDIKHPGFTP